MALIKYTSFGPYNTEGAPVAEVVKTANMASYHSEYLPEIASFLEDLSPKAGHIYVLSNALGGSEVWGSNNNGDLFPASPRWGIANPGKQWGYETFTHFADVFRHHRNEKSKGHPSYGKILCSAWNPRMWRVETIAEIKRDQPDIEDVISDLGAGKPAAVSMGCRIPFDECSLCGHRARTSAQHCDHLKIMLKKVMPNGLLVGMINYYPIFFDQSFVTKGADPSAWAHRTVAEGPAIFDNGEVKMAEDESATTYSFGAGFQKAAAEVDKAAAIYKEVPGGQATHQVAAEHGQTIRSFLKDVRPKLMGREESMPKQLQSKMAADYSMSQIWSTLHCAGIELKPEEFQYMALCQAGHDKLAEELSDQGVVFEAVAPDETKRAYRDLRVSTHHISPDLFDMLVQEEIMEKRSYWRPFLLLRTADLCKEAMHPVPGMPPPTIMNEDLYPAQLHDTSGDKDSAIVPVLAALAGAYALARNQLARINPRVLQKWINASPKGNAMALSTVGGLDRAKVRRAMDKDLLSVAALPIAGLIAAEGLRDMGEGIGPRPRGEIYWESPHMKTADVKGFLGRSLIGVPLSYGAAGYYDAKERVGGELGGIESFVQSHPIATGAAGAGGALYAGKKLKARQAGELADDVAAGASATKSRANQLWDLSKKWLGGLSKRADLLEQMAINPALYDVEPAVADRILVDAVGEIES